MPRSARRNLLHGTTRDLGAEGDGVVEDAAGKVWFVRGVLPGDALTFRPDPRARSANRGRLVSLTVPSRDRTTPFCAHHVECGGCPTMAWHADTEQRWKVRRVAEALDFEPADVSWVPSRQEAYRCRARLAFQGSRVLGYRYPRSQGVVDIGQCPILIHPLQEGLVSLRKTLLPTLAGMGEISLAVGIDQQPVFRLDSETPQPAEAFRASERLVSDGSFAGVELCTGGVSVGAAFGDPRPRLASADGGPLIIPSGGFSQANEAISQRLQELIAEWAHPTDKAILELYAGAGSLTVGLAAGARAISTIESDPNLVACARENLSARQLNAHFITGDAATPPPASYDAVVLDPPRAGALDALRALSNDPPRQIVYVSCHVGTLGRDASFLKSLGYAIDRVAALDMFPQTTHIETVTRFVGGHRSSSTIK